MSKAFRVGWSVFKGEERKTHPCPSCKKPNRLSNMQKRRGYQCDECADKDESQYRMGAY